MDKAADFGSAGLLPTVGSNPTPSVMIDIDHLEKVSKIVATWPKWKQGILGLVGPITAFEPFTITTGTQLKYNDVVYVVDTININCNHNSEPNVSIELIALSSDHTVFTCQTELIGDIIQGKYVLCLS